jgi:hypothetical protein
MFQTIDLYAPVVRRGGRNIQSTIQLHEKATRSLGKYVLCIGLAMSACLLYAGSSLIVDKVNSVALSNNDHSEGLQSAAEFHNKPLAHFDFFPHENHRETNKSIRNSLEPVHPIVTSQSESADEVLLQLSLAFEIAVCVVLLMLFLERLQNFGKAQKQRSTVENLERLQV